MYSSTYYLAGFRYTADHFPRISVIIQIVPHWYAPSQISNWIIWGYRLKFFRGVITDERGWSFHYIRNLKGLHQSISSISSFLVRKLLVVQRSNLARAQIQLVSVEKRTQIWLSILLQDTVFWISQSGQYWEGRRNRNGI